ncbi:DUF3592 domain-containing protein [Streptomyces longwoodensis]|uniref:DUF3592 domain-containing protein n=1 Tax=Streptomyces longwoodensis TaxID=68231 RepID=UPI0036922CDE
MDVIFSVFPGLIAAGALFTAYRVVYRSAQLRRAWNSGLTAEGRCLRTFTTTHGGHDTSVRTTLHHVYEFSTRDGRSVRFEEEDGPATVLEGDVVTVHYTQDRDVVATARRPAQARAAAATLGTLVFLGTIVVFCVAFVVTYATEFRA